MHIDICNVCTHAFVYVRIYRHGKDIGTGIGIGVSYRCRYRCL